MRRMIYFTLVLAVISVPVYGDDNAQSHIIKDVKYYPMLDGYCAMTALRMNLSYYGIEAEQSLLLNLGWDYGFYYMAYPGHAVAFPDTNPIEEIVFAAEHLGFKAEVITHESLDAAKKTIVKYISQDKPVIVQWLPHTVLAYGYKDGGAKIIYHDPGRPRSPIEKFTGGNFPIGLGEGVEKDVNEWVGWPMMWNMRQFAVIVIEPVDKKAKIDWKVIWKRNAEKTLGLIQDKYPGNYGISGLQEMANSINAASSQNTGQDAKILENLEMTFELGVGFRRDAATFLAGQASVLKDENLSKASNKFLESAHRFGEGLSLLRSFKGHPEKLSEVEKGMVQIIQQIIDSEKSAANSLLDAGGTK